MNLNVRIDRLRSDGTARNETAAADRRDHVVQLTQFFHQLETASALPGDDIVVVVGRNESHPCLVDYPLRDLLSILRVAVIVDQLCPIPLHRAKFHLTTVLWNDYLSLRTEELPSECNALPMITGGECKHAFFELLGFQL